MQLTGRRSESRDQPANATQETDLAELSRATAGRYVRIYEGDDLDEIIDSIGAELRQQYVLGFPVRSDDSTEFHDIEVRVDGRKHRIKHRLSYRGSAPAYAPVDQEVTLSSHERGAP